MNECCSAIKDLGCIYSCDTVETGETAAATGIYILEKLPDSIKVVKTTISSGSEIVFAAGYLNEDATTVFKIIKPDGSYFETSSGADCFKVSVKPASNPILAVPADTLCDFVDSATALEIKNCMSDAQVDDMQDLICEGAHTLCDHVEEATAVQIYDCMNDAQRDDMSEFVCDPSVVTLRNTDGDFLSTTNVDCDTPTTITAPDATVTLIDSTGVEVLTEPVASGDSENITIPDGTYPDPSILSTNLYLHLDATGLLNNTDNAYGTVDGTGKVSSWKDLSGNSRHFTQGTGANQPVIAAAAVNGLTAIEFGSSVKYLQNNTKADWAFLHSGSGYSAYFMVRVSSNANPGIFMYLMGTNKGSNANVGFTFAFDDNAANRGGWHHIANGGVQVMSNFAGEIKTPEAWGLFMFQLAPVIGAVTTKSLMRGDLSGNTALRTGSPTSANPSFNINIGAGGDGHLPVASDMRIAEIAIYNTFHTPSQTEAVWAYLKHKYNLL